MTARQTFASRRQQAWEMILDGRGSVDAASRTGISGGLAGAMAVKRARLEDLSVTPPPTWTEAAQLDTGKNFAGRFRGVISADFRTAREAWRQGWAG